MCLCLCVCLSAQCKWDGIHCHWGGNRPRSGYKTDEPGSAAEEGVDHQWDHRHARQPECKCCQLPWQLSSQRRTLGTSDSRLFVGDTLVEKNAIKHCNVSYFIQFGSFCSSYNSHFVLTESIFIFFLWVYGTVMNMSLLKLLLILYLRTIPCHFIFHSVCQLFHYFISILTELNDHFFSLSTRWLFHY